MGISKLWYINRSHLNKPIQLLYCQDTSLIILCLCHSLTWYVYVRFLFFLSFILVWYMNGSSKTCLINGHSRHTLNTWFSCRGNIWMGMIFKLQQNLHIQFILYYVRTSHTPTDSVLSIQSNYENEWLHLETVLWTLAYLGSDILLSDWLVCHQFQNFFLSYDALSTNNILEQITTYRGPSWSYGSWNYNYLCNQCLSPLMLWVRILIRPGCTTLCDKVL